MKIMNTQVGLLVACLTLVSLIEGSDDLSCYECDSLTDSKCKDPFDGYGDEDIANYDQEDCSTGCYKLKAESGGIQYVKRGCGLWTSTIEDACHSTTYKGLSAEICDCRSSSYCNMATPVKFSGARLTVMYVLTLVYKLIL